MAIIRWSPFRFPSLLDEDWWGEFPTREIQGLNIYETENAIIAEAAMPGVPENKIDVTVSDNVVRITGAVEEKTEEKGKKRYLLRKMASSVNYAFLAPEGVKGEPEAELEDGVLKLTWKKPTKTAPKKITVKKVAQKKAV